MTELNGALVNVAIAELPDLVRWLKQAFRQRNPDAPAVTDDEVIVAYQEALRSSLAKDAAWLAAHPADA